MARSALPKIKPGWFLFWNEQKWRIVAVNSKELTALPRIESSDEDPVEEKFEFRQLYARDIDPNSTPIFAATEAELSKAIIRRRPMSDPVHPGGLHACHLKEAQKIFDTVKTVEENIAKRRLKALKEGKKLGRVLALRDACEEYGIPQSTYYHRLKIYNKNGGNINKIAGYLRRNDFNQGRKDRSMIHFVDMCIIHLNMPPSDIYEMMKVHIKHTEGYWINLDECDKASDSLIQELLNTKIKFSTILENNEKAKLLAKIEMPKRTWFFQHYRWYKSLPESGREYISEFYGVEVWEREYMLFDTFVKRASLPLQYVFGDHWWIDVLTVDEETREHRYRLWLTVLIDAYTRCPLGIALLHEHPCIDSIQTALHHAIWPKEPFGDLDLPSKWPCCGIPLYLLLDNAWAHHSNSLEHLAHAIGQANEYTSIELEFRRPYKGRYGALIERFFGNLSRRIKMALKDNGAILSGDTKHIRSARQDACLLYQDIYRIILEIIIDYLHKPHSELEGMTPYQKWVSAVEESGYPIIPNHTPEIERLFWRYAPKEVAITSKGISAFGMEYTSRELQTYCKSKDQPSHLKYHYSYDVDDIGRLAIFQNGKFLFDVLSKELRLPNGDILSVSLPEMMIARHIAKSKGVSPRLWYKFLANEMVDIVRRRRAEQKAIQKKNKKDQNNTNKDEHNNQNTDDQSNNKKNEHNTNRAMSNLLHFGRQSD